MGERNNETIIKIPKKSSKLAELIGIILGDGHVGVYNRKKGQATYQLKIAGHSELDRDYMLNYVIPLIEELFGVKCSNYVSRDRKCIYVSVSSKQVINFLIKSGMKPGNKLKNEVCFPEWIWTKEKYVESCLRGLIDTDGSIYELLPHWPGLFQISLENMCWPLLRDARNAFIKLGFNPSKIHGNKHPKGNRVCLTRKNDIQKFYKGIKFHNSRHVVKYSPIV